MRAIDIVDESPITSVSADSVAERAKRKLVRDLGPLAMEALGRPGCRELIRNADGALWFEGLQTGMVRIGTMSHAQAEAVVKTVAGFHGKEATRATPIVEGELPFDGSRFAGQLPPIVSSPTFAIRKKAIAVYTLDQYVNNGTMTAAQRTAIGNAVRAHENILVVGGTGSGKTTLVNAVIHEMCVETPTDRLCIIEDTGELQCTAENYVQYHTSLNVTMTQLLRLILRMRPERILVGEVRGGEALDLLDSWSTGHPGGAATLHANSALSGLTRLNSLVTRNEAAPTDINKLIGEAINVVVYIARTPEGRRVQEVITLDGFVDGQFVVKHNLPYESGRDC
jgi:type IV secretion system protein VirB11